MKIFTAIVLLFLQCLYLFIFRFFKKKSLSDTDAKKKWAGGMAKIKCNPFLPISFCHKQMVNILTVAHLKKMQVGRILF